MLCVQHSRTLRGTFEFLVNRLRGKTIPVRLVKRLGKAVCVCHSTDVSGDEEVELALSDARKWLDGVEKHEKDQYTDWYPDGVIRVLKRLCLEAGEVEKGLKDRVGKLRMLTVLMKLEKGDVSCIPPAQKKTSEINPDVPLKYEEEFKLDLMSRHAGLLVGAKGKHFKLMSQKYEAEIGILTKRRVSSSTVNVKVTTQHVDSLKPLVDELKMNAKIIKAAREKHEKLVADWSKKQAEHRAKRWQRNKLRFMASGQLHPQVVRPEEFKEEARAVFEKKRKPKNSVAKVKSMPVLENGHCMHCMAHFYKGANEKGSCKFHNGFQQNGQWSCCEELCDGQTTHEMHATTGCTFGRHVWRPGAAHKVKQNGNKKGAGQKRSQLGCFDVD